MDTSKTAILFSTLAFCTATLAGIASAQDKDPPRKLYCWTEKGHKICGDALPPEAADAARTELSASSGNTTATIDRSLTGDERAAAAQAEKLAAQAADADAAQKRRDLAMVESYNTEDDLRRAYGERITLVEESLKTSRLGMINLRQSLLSLLRQAADLELQQKPVGKTLVQNIVHQHADLLRQQTILHQQLDDRASLGSDLEQALSRYRSLKGGKSTG